jgi:hypothetical protein
MMTGAAMIVTQRLAMTPMSCEAMGAILAADWQRADRLLGTPFPIGWRENGWGWLAPRVVEGDLDARLLVWGTRLARLIDEGGQAIAEVGFHGPPDDDGRPRAAARAVRQAAEAETPDVLSAIVAGASSP